MIKSAKKSSHQANFINHGSDNMKQVWEIKKLGNICSIQLGKTPYRKNPKFWDKEKLSGNVWLSISDLKHGEYISESAEQVTDLGAKEIVKIPKGTMLLSFKLTLGRVSFAGTDLYTNEAIAALLNLNKNISKDFLFYYFSLFDWDKAAEGDVKVKGKTLNKQKLKELQIPLPPLPEQQRIVSVLDAAFAAITKAKANAEQNLKNARELFESVLNNLIIDDGKVKMEKLSDVCEIKGRIGYRGYTVQDLVQKGEGAITLSPTNIQDNKFITDKCTYISWFKYEESPEIMVFEGDILFVKTGSTFGKVALVENLPEKATINPQFVVFKEIKCSNRFLYYALTTKAFKEKVENIVGGAATPTLSQTNLAVQTIPLPPLKEQQTIVRQLDALRAETQKLEAVYQKKIDDLEELKKSILQKAFSGGLNLDFKDSQITTIREKSRNHVNQA